jgi:molybdopterin synthase sulfur carrier subunit
MARLFFLGRLEDVAGVAEMCVEVPARSSLTAVVDRLPPHLAAALGSPRIRIAVNGEVVGPDRLLGGLMIADGDEVAFLPPVSGG